MKKIPLRKQRKEPRDTDWRLNTYTQDQISRWVNQGGNVGLRLEATDLVIDIDTKHDDATGRDAQAIEDAIELEYGIDLSVYSAVETGSGGRHIYMQKPAALKTRERLKDVFGGAVEFKSLGRQVLGPGCIHPNGNRYQIIRKGRPAEAPPALLAAIERPKPQRSSGPPEVGAVQLGRCFEQMDPTEFRNYDDWRNLMFAAHQASGGDPAARDVFKAWSAGDPQYAGAGGEIDYFWDACDADRDDARTALTIFWHVIQAGGAVPPGPAEDDFPEWDDGDDSYQPSWWMTVKGKIRGNSPHNAVEAMRVLSIAPRFNRLTNSVFLDGVELVDATITAIRFSIMGRYRPRLSSDPTADAVNTGVDKMAHDASYHPIVDYLEAQKWDGTKRLETWLIDAAGAEDTPYVRATSRLLLVAAVARIFNPGVKYDQLVIFEGPQGIGKSRLIRHLGGEWTKDGLPPIRSAIDKDVVASIMGKWLVEIEEMEATRKADVEILKAFLSHTEDRVRLAYARRAETFPRSCVFIGTTNDTEYLRDMTGNRRFLPITLSWVDLAKVDRNQLWAEATIEWKAGFGMLHLPESLVEQAAEQQEQRRLKDSWEDELRELMLTKWVGTGFVSTSTILAEGLHLPIAQQSPVHMKRLSNVMGLLGIRRGQSRVNGIMKKGYYVPEETPGARNQDYH